jgi:hypothetical protein
MKHLLTPEQSATLIAKGISADKASEIKEYDDEVSQWTHKGYPLFAFADLLSLLPKTINPGRYYLDLSYGFGDWTASYILWDNCDGGTYIRDTQGEKTADELVDALYKLLLWAIDHNHIKLD